SAQWIARRSINRNDSSAQRDVATVWTTSRESTLRGGGKAVGLAKEVVQRAGQASGCGLCFFFPGEDGIRGRNVTGVQTCALPIYFPLLDIADIKIRPIEKGGSDRKFYRIRCSPDQTLILVKYNLEREENRHYVEIAKFLEAHG